MSHWYQIKLPPNYQSEGKHVDPESVKKQSITGISHFNVITEFHIVIPLHMTVTHTAQHWCWHSFPVQWWISNDISGLLTFIFASKYNGLDNLSQLCPCFSSCLSLSVSQYMCLFVCIPAADLVSTHLPAISSSLPWPTHLSCIS